MIAPVAWRALAVGGMVASAYLANPSAECLRETATWLLRPAVLPHAWQAVEQAQQQGDASELFARGQQLLRWLPSWSDGQLVVAYRYALGSEAQPVAPEVAAQRLLTALAYLDAVRETPRARLSTLLQTMSMLPLVAELREPRIAESLRSYGGPAGLADHYLALAEQLTGARSAREQRLFLVPRLAAGLLERHAHANAINLLQAAIQQAAQSDDAAVLAWRELLVMALRRLTGDRSQADAELLADERFAHLAAYLR